HMLPSVIGGPVSLGFIDLWDKCRSDHRRERVLEMQDKQIAHRGEMTKAPPFIDDILGFSIATARALEKLAQGAGAVSLSLDGQLVGYSQQADRFLDRT